MDNENNKEIYRQWAEEQPGLPLFLRPWWLDVTAGEENWAVALSFNKGGDVIGALPYGIFKRKGFKWIETPPLTLHSGPLLKYPEGIKQERRHYFEKEVLSGLALQLPMAHFIRLKCDHRLTNCLPFYWQGFQCTVRYTYHLNLNTPEGRLFSAFSRNVRRNIKKAEQQMRVVSDRTAEEFYNANQLAFMRQGVKPPYSLRDFLWRDQAFERNNCRRLFFGIDSGERIHAVGYLIWDQDTAYYHLSGDDPALRRSGAGFLIVWEAIKFAKNVLNLSSFDFQGSMIKNVEEVRRKFGAQQQSYYQLFKAKNRWLKGFYHFFQE